MSYKPTETKRPYQVIEVCQTCRKPADVTFDERHGPRASLCARHYMDHIDAAGKGATSERFNAAMVRERENQEIIGHAAYNKQSFERMREFAKTFGKRKPDEPVDLDGLTEIQIPETDTDWFSAHGFRRYRPGEEDLMKMKGLK